MADRYILALLGAVMAAMSLAATADAGPKVRVGKPSRVEQQVSMDKIEHGVWDRLLATHVDAQGRVNYVAWKSSSQDSEDLDGYLNTLSRASTSAAASREATLAFWINAYNALTIKGILREYPTTSIRNHTAKLYGYNIWHDLLLAVGDAYVSLDDMEHKVLRKMGEPRVHFAIVCASQSCPRLLSEAYTAKRLEEQLTANAKAFFANSGNFRHDGQSGRFYLSSIMKWFGEDFGTTQAVQLKAIAPYLPDRSSYAAAIGNTVNVSFLDYDWRLNNQPAGSSERPR